MSKLALISVYNKKGVIELASYLVRHNYRIISTGGTAKYLQENDIEITNISDYTNFPEILGGRVKTLNPKIYGGILNIRNNLDHQTQIKELDISNIDVVAVNLYPFKDAIEKNPEDIKNCIENIDIGGVSLLRASAKNYNDVYVLTNPSQYNQFLNRDRKELASEAFRITSNYDSMISSWFSNDVNRHYKKEFNLKYGCNPYQGNASVLSIDQLPFSVLNGNPGYINLLDAINAWNLVSEVRLSLDMDCAASFKHVSPAGVAISSNIKDAYIKARNCDPKCSFGDFIAVNSDVTVELAEYIKTVVTDGIIAPSYSLKALDILKTKKNGKFIILEGNDIDLSDKIEYREYKGCVFAQSNNNKLIKLEDLNNISTVKKDISQEIKRDMVLSLITLKYTQSNSVCFASNGQVIGIGAGQQSRVDCVKLSRNKAEIWILRQHPIIETFKFKDGLKKQQKINLIIQYLENDFSITELSDWTDNFKEVPQQLSLQEKNNFIQKYNNIILASDAFFPFRDSIDKASKIGTKYVVQPGGSIGDKSVINACEQYNMIMVNTNIRLFHH